MVHHKKVDFVWDCYETRGAGLSLYTKYTHNMCIYAIFEIPTRIHIYTHNIKIKK